MELLVALFKLAGEVVSALAVQAFSYFNDKK